MNDLVILRLVLSPGQSTLDVARFVGTSGPARGFAVEVPIDEAHALGCPEEIEFALSTRPLGIHHVDGERLVSA